MKPTHNIESTPKRMFDIKWTEKDFQFFVGRKPEDDDLERCNCGREGIMHMNCGICIHMLPVFYCNICFPKSCQNWE